MSKCLAGLGLDGFVRGDYQEDQVDSAAPASMLVTKPLVSGDVDKAEPYAGFFQEGETKIDGDAAALFFFEAVGMRAGQGLNEGGLAVVDMAGGADDDTFGLFRHAIGMIAIQTVTQEKDLSRGRAW